MFFDNTKEKTPAPNVSGTDVLRAALRARKGHAALLARDLGVGVGALDEFAHGQGQLPDAILTALAKIIFGTNASFDAERNLLVRAKPTAIPPAVGPPRFVPTRKVYPLVAPGRPGQAPPPPQPAGKPGWAE